MRELVMDRVLEIVGNGGGSKIEIVVKMVGDDNVSGVDGQLNSRMSELEGWSVEDESLNGDDELKMMRV
ncbi:hypothetical protein V6N12_062197 [Hibiscus sabdariffa]|uniref:Uncharacterized protein n=1 Tax=Hibiscus sabdariffa TaxID=183260 RepID=A0ABR2F875_9ROSI